MTDPTYPAKALRDAPNGTWVILRDGTPATVVSRRAHEVRVLTTKGERVTLPKRFEVRLAPAPASGDAERGGVGA